MLLILLLLLNVFYSNTIVTSLNEEASALLSFKNSIKEDPGGSLINWNSSDQTPCSWNGITCNDKRVISLSLPKSNLHGFLPSSLGSLTQLRHINLRNNRFNGTLPNELVQVQGLQSLVVFGNFLSGSLPNDIGKLKYLQILDLSQNFFNGSLPISIVQCKRLKSLSLSRNNFYGVLPDGFGTNLTRLEKLDLSFNRFSGFIPYDLSNLSSLEGTADLSHNLFSGSIPASLGNLPEKVYIDLTYNNLTGPIPQNGALINRGPTAFLGNSGLCGPPLKNPCSLQIPNHTSPSSSSSSFLPHRNHPENIKSKKPKGMSKLAVIVIVVSDVIGICLIGLLLSHCFCSSLICSYYNKSTDGKGGKRSGKESLLCFRKDDSESTLSENGDEQCDLVALDAQVGFNLDELLKASAFVLGKSGIGIVYRVVLEDGSTLAVRRLGEGGSQRLKEFQTEVEAIGKLRHPNLVTLKAYYWSVDEKLLIYDYIPNGNLALAIHGKVGTTSSTPLSWSDRLKIMKGIAKGLVYLHEFSPKKYVHGDLKPNNILLGENMEAYISDFGLGRLAKIAGGAPPIQSNRTEANEAEILQEKQQKYGIGPNSESCYQAPESLKVVKPSQKWDVYSFGVILLEMISGRSPVIQVGTREMELVHWIQLCIDEERLISDVLDPGLAQNGENEEEEMIAVLKISMACVHSSPEKRPTMKHVSDILERMGT